VPGTQPAIPPDSLKLAGELNVQHQVNLKGGLK